MTYEGLIIHVAKLATDLKPTALKLLLHLISTAINDGTNEIHTTTRELSKDLNCWRYNVIDAAEELMPYIGVMTSQRHGYRFRLPSEWFNQARGLFEDYTVVDKTRVWPEIRPTSGPESDPPVGRKPIHRRRTNSETRSTSGSDSGPNRRTDSENIGPCGSEIAPNSTQNQQLTADSECRSIDGFIEIQYNAYASIEHIACAKVLTPEQRPDAVELSTALRTFFSEYGPSDRDQRPPDQQILARCLAVAPLGSLLSELKKMRQRPPSVGSSYAWFVSVFAQRLRGIKPSLLRAAYQQSQIQRRRRPQHDLDFSTRMTDEIRQRARKIS